jgi:hypothetical protein
MTALKTRHRTITRKSLTLLLSEVEHLKKIGWSPLGEMSRGKEGQYIQVMVRNELYALQSDDN